MGVYRRPDSKYWWLWLETAPPGQQKEKTEVLVGETVTQRHDSKQLAVQIYHRRMLSLARAGHDIPEPEPEPTETPTFDAFADWYDAHHIVHHKGAEREREMLTRLRRDFGAMPLDRITKAVVIEWRTQRRQTATTVERFGLTTGDASIWRQLHAALRARGPMTLADMRALFPVSTRDVCSTIRSQTAAPFFRRVRRGVWAAVGTPPIARQQYGLPSAATVNREVDLLQQILSAAVTAGKLAQSPIYGLKNLPVVKPIRRTMSEVEEELLLEVLAPDDAAILLVGLDTLARLTDILDLQWLDDHGDTLDIRDPKNGQSHTVPISSRLRAALDALPRTGKYMFARRRRGTTQAIRRKTVANALKRACQKAGLPYGRAARGITFHWSTRRTGATRMIRRGGEKAIAVVQRIGNWKTANVLIGIYQETITDEMKAAVETVAPKSPRRPPQRAFGAKVPGQTRAKNPSSTPVVLPWKAKDRA
jgi:integrase